MRTKTLVRFAFALVAAVVVVGAPRPAEAQTLNLDRIVDRPASTLLLPYFEANLDGGVNTTFTLNNASATAVLAHVTVWTDLSVPVLAFNLYLTGYDAVPINMREVINGRIPRTASNGQDPGDVISNKGDASQDINFASCGGQLPPPAQLPTEIVVHNRTSMTGRPSPLFGGKCSGLPSGSVARGYVTIDTVNNCTLRVAGDPAYPFDITDQNVLWGEYQIVTPGNALGRGDALVHIRSGATDPETSVPGQYTFYGRYVNWTAVDHRQPLATNWAAPFNRVGDFPSGTAVVVWRDTKVNQAPFTCGSLPSWYPLPHEGVRIFNESESTAVAAIPTALGAATQKVRVGAGIPTAFPAGWIYFNLNHAAVDPPEDPAAAASFVYVMRDNVLRFSHGTRATPLDSATQASHFFPN
jgi:hypothetical protein